ncbi:MAG: PIN domain-containing protein [Candidatus Pacearchaeota archaeon]
MKNVVDANILFSALIAEEGKTREFILFSNVSLYAPEYLMEEIEKYEETIIKKSGLSKESIETAKSIILSRINILPKSEFRNFMNKASKICPDPNDEEYFALVLKLECPLRSDDKKLKESGIKVLTTSEILEQYS